MNIDIGGGTSAQSTPAINNACLPNIYDKLDADAREKVRVVNSMLNQRLQVQEKIIDKYRRESMKVMLKEKERLRYDLKKIAKKSPSVPDIRYLNFMTQYKNGRTLPELKFKGYTTEPHVMKGLQTEKECRPFCDRYYTHHIHTNKQDKSMTHALSTGSLSEVSNFPVSNLLLSKTISASDNFLAGKRRNKLREGKSDACMSAGDDVNRTLLLNKVSAEQEDDVMTI